MKLTDAVFIAIAIFVAVMITNAQVSHAQSEPFSDPDSVAFAEKLWQAMAALELVGPAAKSDQPYKGIHPHGAVLETLVEKLTIDGREGEVLVKRNYGGTGVSVEAVTKDRARFIKDITVMFKREKGYDDDNQDWFWAKFKTDGNLDTSPSGKKLAGRVAKGKSKGCIACHKTAPGGDYLFIN